MTETDSIYYEDPHLLYEVSKLRSFQFIIIIQHFKFWYSYLFSPWFPFPLSWFHFLNLTQIQNSSWHLKVKSLQHISFCSSLLIKEHENISKTYFRKLQKSFQFSPNTDVFHHTIHYSSIWMFLLSEVLRLPFQDYIYIYVHSTY